ncbi:hypothetical protein [Bradyrhizobium frederickii]|uniref:hypothetical protein n=1 Tax=Bradyrhizobium frederickii TaxID=2560054 RepID=UPI001430CF26|nr:hypothetical protein [Bradyrhizobium frederickii]
MLQVRKLAVALAEVVRERKTRLVALVSAMAVRSSATWALVQTSTRFCACEVTFPVD